MAAGQRVRRAQPLENRRRGIIATSSRPAGLLAAVYAASLAVARSEPAAPPADGDRSGTAAVTADPAGVLMPEEGSADRPRLGDEPRPPTTVPYELSEIRPGVALKRRFDELAAESNLRLGIANTLLFQQASGGPGDRSAAGGDLDLLAKWTAVGAGTPDTGIVAFAAEYRYQIGDRPPAALGEQIGTLLPTTNGFGERPMTVKELYWDHHLFGDRIRYVLGRVDPENVFGGHALQSQNLYFLNKSFSSNPAVAYPGPGLAAVVRVRPVDWAYIGGGVTDANGTATTSNVHDFFDDGEFLALTEMGLTPKFEKLGSGRYRLAFWHRDAGSDSGRSSDAGVTISCDQELGEHLIAFARYGHADGDVTGVTDSVQGGLGIRGVLGDENMLGLAGAWSDPKDTSKDPETVLEIFQRFQVTETTQFTVGVELIIGPGDAPDDDVIGVYSARLRTSF